MFVYRGQNVDGITQGFSKGDPRDILKDMTGGARAREEQIPGGGQGNWTEWQEVGRGQMVHKLQQDSKYLLTFELSECTRHCAIIHRVDHMHSSQCSQPARA